MAEAKPKTKISKKSAVKEVKVVKQQEPKFTAIELAKNFIVSDFEFLMLKRDNNINDNTLMTADEFKQIYNKSVGR